MSSETVKVFKEDEEDEIPEEMQSAHEKIVHHLMTSVGIPERVDHVKILVSELQRISILWDELWFGSIQQYSSEIIKRVKKMEEEAKRLEKNKNLNAEEKQNLVKDKYYILFKPILFVFNKIEAIMKNPESPMEVKFHEQYGKIIQDMMSEMKEPSNFAEPREILNLVRVHSKIGAKLYKKGSLNLPEISPALANLKDTLIPLPGQELTTLNINTFDNLLAILPTKTKPKKIKLYANDGKSYTYLFKGLEDLHLDERIMQFLSIANTLMKTNKTAHFNARHYSVVPLGPRSGLIQWVEGAVPLFSLYKKWHQRQQTIVEMSNRSKDSTRTLTPKPADQFFNKLIPLLHDQVMPNLDNRKDLPIGVMRQVLTELMDETPKDLISSTLYLSSKNSDEWHQLTSNLTRSIAVMSVIGYIIGLGDRHLDNLLIDFQNGEIIHIDYNVCFEKGAKLRIPEKVPCRLTQNIVNVFGVTGVEGLFRMSCERTLEILRGGKETLLTLLEAFIYDPLVDWTPGVELGLAGAFGRLGHPDQVDGNQDKRDMQAEITFSMLSVRIAEIRGSWMQNKTSLLQDLIKMEDHFTCWIGDSTGLGTLRESLGGLNKALTLLKEAETNSSHKLYALQDRFAEHRAVETAVEASKSKISAFIEEYEKMAASFSRVMGNIASAGQLTKWSNELASHSTASKMTSETISEFLRSAGQVHLLEQVEQIETGLRISLDKIKASISLGLQLLGHCTTMAAMYPQGYRDEHRITLYLKWMQQLVDDFEFNTCQSVVNEFNAKFVDKNPEFERLQQHQVMNLNYQLETWSQDIHFRLQNIFKRMISHGIENSKTVQEAGLLIQNEAATYILAHPGLCRNLCLNTLGVSMDRIRSLENLIIEENFAVQMNGDLLLLDELLTEVSFCGNVFDFMEKFDLIDGEIKKVMTAFTNVYKQFKNLIGSYFAIILQEGLKNCQREDGAMEEAAKQIQEIITSENEAKFATLIQNLNEKVGNLTSGQMIIMAMNSLLENIDSAVKETQFEKELLDTDCLKLRLECVSEFFSICFRAMNSFKADGLSQFFPNGDEMGYPIIKYMAKYYLKFFKGRVVNYLFKVFQGCSKVIVIYLTISHNTFILKCSLAAILLHERVFKTILYIDIFE